VEQADVVPVGELQTVLVEQVAPTMDNVQVANLATRI